MKFSELAGRKGRAHFMVPHGFVDLETSDIEAANWEPIEQRDCSRCGWQPGLCKCGETIARLERELSAALTGEAEQRQACARLSLQVSELQSQYIQQSAKCCRCCSCFMCTSQRQNAALGNQGCR